mmetsp:Transcript_52669/g.140438  ORF Transcript_52669/g.140438 Transcript_52669/m.140438 type:complete len:946 (-) Transcript_52669:8-2845(-)
MALTPVSGSTLTSSSALEMPLRSSHVQSQSIASDSRGRETTTASSCCGHDRSISFETVLAQERACIEKRGRGVGQPFSVALSGGGVRAAAFQAGVLWRLAQEGRLQDVEYMSAVSGGAYVASAFATHCAEEPPPTDDDWRAWYLRVVAKMVCRMQENSGNFVRDCWANPLWSSTYSGVFPRFMDLPILVATLTSTMCVHPLMFGVTIMIPLLVMLEFFFAPGLRGAFCWEGQLEGLSFLFHHSPCLPICKYLLPVTLTMNVVLWCSLRCVPACKVKVLNGKTTAPYGHLLAHAGNAFMTRFNMGVLVLLVFVLMLCEFQVAAYDKDWRMEFCNKYVNVSMERPVYSLNGKCTDMWDGIVWWEVDGMLDNINRSKPSANHTKPACQAPTHLISDDSNVLGLLTLIAVVLMILLALSCLCMPCVGSDALVVTFRLVGPLILFFLMASSVQWVVFGPMTNNCLGFVTYTATVWDDIVTFCLAGALITLPLYEELRALFHNYYKRCLQLNFFAKGQDRKLVEFAHNKQCPFLVLTVTSSDYRPPGDTDTISELSFSPLHFGGADTGYVQTPRYAGLAKCTALSGAGGLDAVCLSMVDDLTMRFWLEVLNLSWGDFMTFEQTTTPLMDIVENFLLPWIGREEMLRKLMYRSIGTSVWMLILLLMNIGWRKAICSPTEPECQSAKNLFAGSFYLVLLLIMLTFFSFVPGLDLLGLSLFTRQFLQITKFCHVGERPPRLLYVTDGGVTDCTALVQLMRRRCKRILLVLAAADADDDLLVLKSAMESAEKEQVGSFFDPEEPRRDIRVLFKRFKETKNAPYLHLGICYSWDNQQEEVQTGEVFIVKNRLPPEFCGQPLQPQLTVDEICGISSRENARDAMIRTDRWGDLTSDQLGPFGCCDCCHSVRCLNLGPRFPHGTFPGYLYLTPQWCNSLARLGFAVSGRAVEDVQSRD